MGSSDFLDHCLERPMPREARPRRRRLDPRILIGAVLVVASVAATTALVISAAPRDRVLVATRPLAAGTPLGAAEVRELDVNIERSAPQYAGAEALSPDTVVLRSIGAGELIPAAALGLAEETALTTLVVPGGDALPDETGPGAEVDLWRDAGPRSEAAPELLVRAAAVVSVRRAEGLAAGTGAGSRVELRVPRDEVPRVLAALGSESGVRIVLATGGAR